MANLTTNQIIYDNNQNAVVVLTGYNDGSANDTLITAVDCQSLTYLPPYLKILEMSWDVNGGVVRLFWDDTDPLQFANLASIGDRNYRFFGGMQNPLASNNNPRALPSGNILLSTIGFDVGSSYQIKLVVRKKYHNRFVRFGNEDPRIADWPAQTFTDPVSGGGKANVGEPRA